MVKSRASDPPSDRTTEDVRERLEAAPDVKDVGERVVLLRIPQKKIAEKALAGTCQLCSGTGGIDLFAGWIDLGNTIPNAFPGWRLISFLGGLFSQWIAVGRSPRLTINRSSFILCSMYDLNRAMDNWLTQAGELLRIWRSTPVGLTRSQPCRPRRMFSKNVPNSCGAVWK